MSLHSIGDSRLSLRDEDEQFFWQDCGQSQFLLHGCEHMQLFWHGCIRRAHPLHDHRFRQLCRTILDIDNLHLKFLDRDKTQSTILYICEFCDRLWGIGQFHRMVGSKHKTYLIKFFVGTGRIHCTQTFFIATSLALDISRQLPAHGLLTETFSYCRYMTILLNC